MPKCFYCDAPLRRKSANHIRSATVDHVFPKQMISAWSHSAEWQRRNRVTCCKRCNNKKGHMPPSKWIEHVKHPAALERYAHLLAELALNR